MKLLITLLVIAGMPTPQSAIVALFVLTFVFLFLFLVSTRRTPNSLFMKVFDPFYKSQHWPQHCDLCSMPMQTPDDRAFWHGIGNCVPICDACTGSGTLPPTVGMVVTLVHGKRYPLASGPPKLEYEILRIDSEFNMVLVRRCACPTSKYYAPLDEFKPPPCPACSGRGRGYEVPTNA